MDGILSFFSLLVANTLGYSASGPFQRASDRRLLTKGQVRCELAAAEGRVLNIGTEWSGGVCHLSPGHLRFIPQIGIVGEREIDVLSISRSGPPAGTRFTGDRECVTVTTAEGELYWAIPESIAEQVIEKVVPKPTNASP